VDSKRNRRQKERQMRFSIKSRVFTFFSQSCVKCRNIHVRWIYVISLFDVAAVLVLVTLWIFKIIMPSKSLIFNKNCMKIASQ
jgi:hypothetical protein